MQTYSSPCCYLCSSNSDYLFKGLRDKLYNVPGVWNFRKCSNPQCGLVWLDPMPSKDNIEKLYQKYHTHQTNSVNGQKKTFNAYIKSFAWWTYGILLKLTFVHRMRRRHNCMYLETITPGRLLDVGCGNGQRLSQLQTLGWDVEGQEIDPKAVMNAQHNYGIKIHLGNLHDIAFSSSIFDAIIMGHVIEHLIDPLTILTECHRILKPGGILVITTPNVESFGRKYFKSAWRGLEAPRHIYLFSPKTLHHICERAGFQQIRIFTSAAYASGIAKESLNIIADINHKKIKSRWIKLYQYIWAFGFQLAEIILYLVDKNSGESCVLKSIK